MAMAYHENNWKMPVDDEISVMTDEKEGHVCRSGKKRSKS